MKVKIFLKILLLSVCVSSNAQKELWGINTGAEYTLGYFGNITKYDINGENPVMMHEFDSIHGYTPKGKLFLASNGKLYGTCQRGGNLYSNSGGVNNYSCGVLYEYDLILDRYRVVHNFEFDNTFPINPQIGVIEPVTGILYGATRNRAYKYDMTTETTTIYNTLGSLYTIFNEFIKASDGNLYSTTAYSYCPTSNHTEPWDGSIIKFNMTTSNLDIERSLDCTVTNEGNSPYSVIETSPGILYGETRGGGIYQFVDGQFHPGGILFEYNFLTHTYTKKIDFNGLTIGGIPAPVINGGNGKIYGLCEEGGAPQTCNPTYNFGTLYEYTLATNVLEVKQKFSFCGNSVRYPTSLIKTSVGHFMGTIPGGGLFKYDPATNGISMPNYTSNDTNLYNAANLIEICRKPSYHFFDTDTFDACVGSNFNYDVQNTNATSYQWIKDGTNVPAQTTGILNLTNITLADTGNYTCLMTNECGTTTTMALHLTVSCLGTNIVATLDRSIKLHPNPANSWLNIELPQNIDIAVISCSITNILGQTVYQAVTANKLDISQLQDGIYIVSLQTNYGRWNGRFVKD